MPPPPRACPRFSALGARGAPAPDPKGFADPGKTRSVAAPRDPPMPHRTGTPLGQKAGRNPHRDLPSGVAVWLRFRFPARRAGRAKAPLLPDRPAAEGRDRRPPACLEAGGRGTKTVVEITPSLKTRQHAGSVVNGACSCQSCGFCSQWLYLPMDMFRAGNARSAQEISPNISICFNNFHFVRIMCQHYG